MLNLLELFDEHLVWLLRVEPELGAIGDGRDDHGFVKEAEVGGGDACDSVAEDFEAGHDSSSFLGKEGHVVSERELSVQMESEPADRCRGCDGDFLTIKGGSEWRVRFVPVPAKVHQITFVRINTHAGCRKHFHQGFQRLLEKVHVHFQVVGNGVQPVIIHVSSETYGKIVGVRFVENRVFVEGFERYGRVNARENRRDR